jgi:hypothetical protein
MWSQYKSATSHYRQHVKFQKGSEQQSTLQITQNYVTFNKIFIRCHTKSVHADAKKVGLQTTQIPKKLIEQAMETVLHATTARKRL